MEKELLGWYRNYRNCLSSSLYRYNRSRSRVRYISFSSMIMSVMECPTMLLLKLFLPLDPCLNRLQWFVDRLSWSSIRFYVNQLRSKISLGQVYDNFVWDWYDSGNPHHKHISIFKSSTSSSTTNSLETELSPNIPHTINSSSSVDSDDNSIVEITISYILNDYNVDDVTIDCLSTSRVAKIVAKKRT